MGAGASPRLCIGEGCGVDISHRKHNAVRCDCCQAAFERIMKADWRRHGVAKETRPVRYCACNCGAEITHMRKDALRLPGCAAKFEAERRKRPEFREQHRAYMERQNQKRKERRASGPKAVVEPKLFTDPERRSTKWCDYCCGIPDARVSDRPINDSIGSPMVANQNGICKGCKLPWAPAAPIPRGPGIRSSGGTASDSGRLYGGERCGMSTHKLSPEVQGKSNFAGWRRIKKGSNDGK